MVQMLANMRYDFDLFSIIFIILIAVMFIVGFAKGFFSVLIDFAKHIVTIVAGIFLAKPLANLLMSNTSWDENIASKIFTWIGSKSDIFTQTVDANTAGAALTEGLGSLGLPGFLTNGAQKLITSIINSLSPGETFILGEEVANALTYIAFIAISFLVVVIIVSIVLVIIKSIFKNINKVPILGFVNRLGGAALSLVIAVLIVSVICWGLNFIIAMGGNVSEFLTREMRLNDEGVWTLSKFFYEHNFIQYIFQWLL